ncbi:MAG TPA: prenyltransferase/squalene oxidase repeat-containing protein [Terriglobia bacterium]|nr:prenyltransferase/squalene oxidase repeat-containing protein [Terriglobia bacterium]
MKSLLKRLRTSLIARELPQGGWLFLRGSGQTALEPTCLALLALRRDSSIDTNILVHTQRSDGGWGAFTGDDQASGLSGLALLTLNTLGTFQRARSRAVRWLLNNRGKEASWPWNWKFRTRDTHARFDPDKFGWPWQPGTCSWVVPTAFAVLALKQSFPCCCPSKVAFRIRRGVEMLVDRACSGGGWNAGNGVVYGSPMAAHVDATAIALLALQGDPPTEITTRSVQWLEGEAYACEAPWSLAWAILALHAHGKPVKRIHESLAGLAEFDALDDMAVLAAVVLALDCATSCNPFKVTP